MNTTILVAEQEDIARTSLSELLRDEGYRVLEAGYSADALNHIDSDTDLRVILLDLEMIGSGLVIQHAQRLSRPVQILGMARDQSFRPNVNPVVGVHSLFLKPLVFGEISREICRILKTGHLP